ncbi:cache domain-containing protein [Bacteroidota bacterium]
MKTIKNSLLIAVCVGLFIFSSCKKEETINRYDMVSQYELNKSVVQTNTTNVATAFQTVFINMPDSADQARVAQSFIDEATYFEDGSGYFFLDTYEGWVVAHLNHALVGTCRFDTTDIYGKYFVREIIQTVKYSGYGFVEFYRRNIATNVYERKLSFVTNLPAASGLLGSGFYGDPEETFYEPLEAKKTVLKECCNTIAKGLGNLFDEIYTDSLQRLDFMREFISNVRFFDDRSGYFFINDLTAFCHAHAANPANAGVDFSDYQDTKGAYFMLEMVNKVVADDYGFVEYYWNNPVSGQEEQKLTYVVRIPGYDFFVGAGIYVE